MLLSGEAGIGKSRLVRAVRERLGADEPYTLLSHSCSPFYQTSALHPVIGLLERAADYARDDSPVCKLEKLEALLRRGTEDVAAVAPLIADLLAIRAATATQRLISPRSSRRRRRSESSSTSSLA